MTDCQKLTTFHGLMDQAYARWTYDTNWTLERFLLDLNYLERVAVLCGTLNYQVENGGFTQWHDNGYSIGCNDLVRILKEVEGPATTQVLELLRQIRVAIRNYAGHSFNQFYEAANSLDDQFYQINEAFCTEVEAYLTARVSETEARGGQ